MGIVAWCPNGHRIKVKDELAGKKGICPTCAASFRIPRELPPAASVGHAAEPSRLPTARVVSLDPHVIATLPRARAIAAAGRPAGP